jgi:hypothetical protein
MRARDFLQELWTRPYPLYKNYEGEDGVFLYFKTNDGRRGEVFFEEGLMGNSDESSLDYVYIQFLIDGEQKTSGRGDAIAIFSTVVEACKKYFSRKRPKVVVFESDDLKKLALYQRIAQELPGYKLYPQWTKDETISDEIHDLLADGDAGAAVVMVRSDYHKTIDEMAGEIHGGVRKALMDKGYQYLGSGIDKQAYLEPGTGQVLIVFGYRKGVQGFSPDQRMFINWINYCNKNKSNPHLPRFSGFDTFKFQGKNYIQARMEPLTQVKEPAKYLINYLEDVVRPDKNPPENMMQAIKRLKQKGYYDEEENEIIMFQIPKIIEYLGGPRAAFDLMKTVQDVMRFGNTHGYAIDLHSGNYMQRPDGTVVVNDPYVLWLKSK